MRIDKFLKVSRIIKRRTLASDACKAGKILINSKLAKPGNEVNIGDIVEVCIPGKNLKVEIINLSEHVRKENAASMYKIQN